LLVASAVLIGSAVVQAVSGFLNYDWQSVAQGIADSLNNMALQVSTVPLVGEEFASGLEAWASALQALGASPVVVVDAGASLENMLINSGKTLGVLGDALGPIISGVVSLFFMMLISLQMSFASGQMRGWAMSLVPDRFTEEIGSLLDRIFFAWTSFLSGQFLLMVVMGTLVWLMNLILGTPQALLLGVLAGFLEIIPTLGPIIATIPAAILALLFGSSTFPELTPWVFMLIVIAGYGLMNLLENQILVPRILGGAVNLPPLIVLIGVTIVGAQAGIAGIFLVTPVMATAKLLVEYVYRKIDQKPEDDLFDGDHSSVMDRVRGFISRIRLPFRRGNKEATAISEPATVEES
jgi:predicted PurR-regulated permease PerM